MKKDRWKDKRGILQEWVFQSFQYMSTWKFKWSCGSVSLIYLKIFFSLFLSFVQNKRLLSQSQAHKRLRVFFERIIIIIIIIMMLSHGYKHLRMLLKRSKPSRDSPHQPLPFLSSFQSHWQTEITPFSVSLPRKHIFSPFPSSTSGGPPPIHFPILLVHEGPNKLLMSKGYFSWIHYWNIL